MKSKFYLPLLFIFVGIFNAIGQNTKSHKFDVDISEFKNKLKNAPKSTDLGKMEALAAKNPNQIFLPMPDGTLKTFHIIGSEVMGEKLKTNFPSINTYRIYSSNKKDNISGTLTISESGLHAILFTPEGDVLINPEKAFATKHNSSFHNLNELAQSCGIGPEHLIIDSKKNKSKIAGTLANNGNIIKTYRMAIVANGEFYLNNGATIESTQTAIVSIVNALKAVYEKELSISFNLVATQIYTDPDTDPFNGSNATTAANVFGTLAGNNLAGFAVGNYDIGHVFHHSPGGGGVAYLGVVCNNYNVSNPVSPIKAGAYSGVTTSYLGTLIHEVGHQFGAGHAFNSISSNCGGGNLMSGSAVEPGSGSTYMSYLGGCSPDNVSSSNGRTYFNAWSINEIINFTQNYGTCYASTVNANQAPVATIGSNITIPKGTPFKLTGSATDVNGNTLYYNWEQVDVAPSNLAVRGGADDAQNSLYSPIFRTYEHATTGDTRIFPNLNQILNFKNEANNEEALPQVPRLINMRFTARDNVAGGGGLDYKDLVVTVDNSGPFLITSQNEPNIWLVGDSKTITWSVNNTNLAPLNVSNINILLSTDGGLTFPVILASNTPNDGFQVITVPNNLASQARIKIESTNASHTFFDINNGNLNIVNTFTCASEVSIISPESPLSANAGMANLNLNMSAAKVQSVINVNTVATDALMRLTGLTNGACSSPYSNSPNYKKINFKVSATGDYTFPTDLYISSINIYKNSFNASSPCTNWQASNLSFVNNVASTSTLTLNLSVDSSYIMVVQPGFGTGDLGNVNITPSGPGSFLRTLPLETSFYAYSYIITNSANTVMAIQPTVNLSNSAVYPADVYTIRGLSYLAGVDLSTYVGQAFSVLQNSFTSTPNCGILSTNLKTITITCPVVPNPVAANVSICTIGTASLSASGCTGGTYNWYATAAGGSSLANTSTFTSPSLTLSTSYYVNCTVNSCSSARIQVIVTVNTPVAPLVNQVGILSGTAATLTATGCSVGIINWYDSNSSTISLGMGSSFTTAILSFPIETKTYFASCTVGTCESVRSSAVVSVCNTGNMAFVSPTNNIITAGLINQKTNGLITATNIINPVTGTMVTYDSGKSILLNPGFEVRSISGGSFKAVIQGCN